MLSGKTAGVRGSSVFAVGGLYQFQLRFCRPCNTSVGPTRRQLNGTEYHSMSPITGPVSDSIRYEHRCWKLAGGSGAPWDLPYTL